MRLAWSNLGPPLRTTATWLAQQRIFLAVLLLLIGSYGLQSPLLQNEPDSLPLARQVWDPNWLPRDWYLNQPTGYRAAFDVSIGWLVAVLPFQTGAILGRLLTFCLFARAVQALARLLNLS